MKLKFIKARLKEMNRDADWLAGECGVSPTTMKQHYLRGVRPSEPALRLMAQALKCTVSDLVYEDEIDPAKAGQ